MCGLAGMAAAKTVTVNETPPMITAEPPFKMEAPIVSASVAKLWSAEVVGTELSSKVRKFIAGDHPAQEKIDVLAWWAGRAEQPDFFVELASRHAVLGQIDQAIYWLQRAGEEDGLDVADLEADEGLAKVRVDPRWAKLKPYLQACEAEWQKSSYFLQILTLPEKYDGKSPIPLVIGLHGFGSVPEDFSGADHQRLSDSLGVAFLSVSGRLPLGRNSFMWSGDFALDWKHIETAIARTRSDLTPALGKMVAIGFSQGGQLAAEITAAHPQHFRGCVSMSPGSRFASGMADRLGKAPTSLAGQQYFFSWISGEGSGPKQRVLSWRPVLEKQKAQVYQYEFPGKGHTFPRNYEDYFAITLQVILR
jgi:predicted esterase